MQVKRVAIIHQAPVYNDFSGGGNLIKFIYESLSKLKYKVVVFSIGPDDKIFKSKNFFEEVTAGLSGIDQGKLKYRLYDALYLLFFDGLKTTEIMSNNYQLINKVANFEPEFVFFSTYALSPLISKIKYIMPKTKFVAFTDSYKQIELAFDAFLNTKLGSLFKFFKLEKFIKIKYLDSKLYLYQKMLEVADTVIFTTPIDENDTLKAYKSILKNKRTVSIPVVPPNTNQIVAKNIPSKHHNHFTIGFVGSYDYLPNKEAIDLILNIIAPKCLANKFLIIGQGVPRKHLANVEFLGFVNDIATIAKDVDLWLAPLRKGVGIKTKIYTYIKYNRPIIGTSIAFAGYNVKNNVNCIIGNEIKDYPTIIKNLESNRTLYNKLLKNTHTLMNFSEKEILTKFKNILV